MSQPLIILPIVVQMAFAIILLFAGTKVSWQRYISMTGSVVGLIIAVVLFSKVWTGGILTTQAGNWEAPYGITFAVDVFSALMVLLASISALAVSIFSGVSLSWQRVRYGYFPAFHFLIMGLNGAFLTGDLFNMYVWFEIIIISSFVLITLGSEKSQLEGAIKYVAMNLLASILFLTAVGVLYGIAGTLNMADLSLKVAQLQNRGLVNFTAMMFLVGFGIKAAIFPLYFWLPASYHTPPSAVSAIFGGLLTKVGVYALVRVFTLIFVPDDSMQLLITGIGVMTIISGALGALNQKHIQKTFSWLIICHIGYMITGLGMFNFSAFAGVIFYLTHDIIVKTNLFMVGGLVKKLKGSFAYEEVGGLYARNPKLSLLMAIPLFSLVGIPPLSGFWPKLNLIEGGIQAGAWVGIGAIIFGSFITLYVIAKLWAEVFWKNTPEASELVGKPVEEWIAEQRWLLILPVVLLSAVSLYIGLGAEQIMKVSLHIAAELADTSTYINAVLGDYLNNAN